MHQVPQAGLTALAVAGTVERWVRRHCSAAGSRRLKLTRTRSTLTQEATPCSLPLRDTSARHLYEAATEVGVESFPCTLSALLPEGRTRSRGIALFRLDFRSDRYRVRSTLTASWSVLRAQQGTPPLGWRALRRSTRRPGHQCVWPERDVPQPNR